MITLPRRIAIVCFVLFSVLLAGCNDPFGVQARLDADIAQTQLQTTAETNIAAINAEARVAEAAEETAQTRLETAAATDIAAIHESALTKRYQIVVSAVMTVILLALVAAVAVRVHHTHAHTRMLIEEARHAYAITENERLALLSHERSQHQLVDGSARRLLTDAGRTDERGHRHE